ncbi:MAG: peptidoglycan DD-metalloendopeptidase family protein [Polyangiales bacterium]
MRRVLLFGTPLFGVLVVLSVASSADAQTRLRRPYAEGYRLNYGFDNNGGAGGCSDYTCAGACYDGHTGSDFGTPIGTTVVAAQAGTVIATNNGCANYGGLGNTCGGRCGNYVQLRHADGSTTIYCHMQINSLQVRNGQSVSCGQAIGRSASSGNSTGPHLHLGWRPGGGASRDPFQGRCGASTSAWVGQAGYREPVSTSCSTCTPTAEVCNGRDDDCDERSDEHASAERCGGGDDDCDGRTDEGDVCEIALLEQSVPAYAPPTTTDVNADGRADVCGRGYGGVWCHFATDDGWSEKTATRPAWSDPNGWNDVDNYATFRMGDLNDDGHADLCARANAGVVCHLGGPDGFAEEGANWRALSDDAGWDAPRHYLTIRLADVNGDGRDDLCARSAAGLQCWLSDGESFATAIDGPRWSNDSGWGAARYYGTIRFGDLNGDGRSDVCARAAAGVECFLSDGEGFPTRIEGPRWSDDAGWGAMQHWSTMRLADVDGDGFTDLCARSASDLRCVRFDGSAFDDTLIVGNYSNESGWDDVSNYATLRVGDVNADGADDLCVRANAGMRCNLWNGEGFDVIEGPGWHDDQGWNGAAYFHGIQLADVDGDRRADVCARAGAGWRCHPARDVTGEDGVERPGFGDARALDEFTNDGGWSAPEYRTTILVGGPRCLATTETCNGVDDDCDRVIDEVSMAETCNGADDDCDGAVDEDAGDEICNGSDDDCDGAVDEDVCGGDASVPGADAGPSVPAEGGESAVGGCGCTAPGASNGPSGAWALAVLGLALGWRRRAGGRSRDRAPS